MLEIQSRALDPPGYITSDLNSLLLQIHGSPSLVEMVVVEVLRRIRIEHEAQICSQITFTKLTEKSEWSKPRLFRDLSGALHRFRAANSPCGLLFLDE